MGWMEKPLATERDAGDKGEGESRMEGWGGNGFVSLETWPLMSAALFGGGGVEVGVLMSRHDERFRVPRRADSFFSVFLSILMQCCNARMW